MHGSKWVNLAELREPGMRRVIEAVRRVEDEDRGSVRRAPEVAQTIGWVPSSAVADLSPPG